MRGFRSGEGRKMKSYPIAACVVGLLTIAAAASAGSISVLVDSHDPQVVISPDYASVHNNPLYVDKGVQGENPLYQGTASNRSTVTDPGMNAVGVPALNSSGAVAFQSVTDPGTPTNGIFVRPAGGNILITIVGTNFRDASGAPAINDAGTVVFKSLDSGGNDAIYATAPGSSAVKITIQPRDSFGNPERLGRPTVNTAGAIAFTGTGGDGTSALYVQPAGANDPIKLTINGNFGLRDAQMVDNHIIAIEQFSNNTELPATFTFDPATESITGGPVKWMAPESLDLETSYVDTGGVIIVCDGESLRAFSDDVVWNGASPPADAAIVNVGDPLDGSTISALSLAPQSLSGNDLTFQATLADGTTGLFSVTVPEPTTAGAIALFASTLLRRRRTR
jgi:hypothetical protein